MCTYRKKSDSTESIKMRYIRTDVTKNSSCKKWKFSNDELEKILLNLSNYLAAFLTLKCSHEMLIEIFFGPTENYYKKIIVQISYHDSHDTFGKCLKFWHICLSYWRESNLHCIHSACKCIYRYVSTRNLTWI